MAGERNILVIDGAINATFSVFRATADEFALIFPGPSQDIEVVEHFIERVGDKVADETLGPLWTRPILRRDVMGIHGVLYFDHVDRCDHLPASKREVDLPDSAINKWQRDLFSRARQNL